MRSAFSAFMALHRQLMQGCSRPSEKNSEIITAPNQRGKEMISASCREIAIRHGNAHWIGKSRIKPPSRATAMPSEIIKRTRTRSWEELQLLFDERAIADLAERGCVPAQANLERFGASVRSSAQAYCEWKNKLGAAQVRDSIERMYKLLAKAERKAPGALNELACLVSEMHDDVRAWLVSHTFGRAIPIAEEILSPETSPKSLEKLLLVLSSGRGFKMRSRSQTVELRTPLRARRGRPRGSAERFLVVSLVNAHEEATGEPPPRWTQFEPTERGPLSRFVHRCFELLHAPTGNVTNLINEYAVERLGPAFFVTKILPD